MRCRQIDAAFDAAGSAIAVAATFASEPRARTFTKSSALSSSASRLTTLAVFATLLAFTNSTVERNVLALDYFEFAALLTDREYLDYHGRKNTGRRQRIPDVAASHQGNGHEATVDGAIGRSAFAIHIDNCDRACPAVSLGAALF